MRDLGMSAADAQLMASQHAGEAAWIIIQREAVPSTASSYIQAYREIYNEIYKLLLRIGPDDVPEWVTILSNYFNPHTIIEGIKASETDPLNQEVSGVLTVRYTRPDNDWYAEGKTETTTQELKDVAGEGRGE